MPTAISVPAGFWPGAVETAGVSGVVVPEITTPEDSQLTQGPFRRIGSKRNYLTVRGALAPIHGHGYVVQIPTVPKRQRPAKKPKAPVAPKPTPPEPIVAAGKVVLRGLAGLARVHTTPRVMLTVRGQLRGIAAIASAEMIDQDAELFELVLAAEDDV